MLRVVCINVRGCSERKYIEEIGRMLQESKLEVLGLNKTNKRRGKVGFRKKRELKSGVG